MQLLAILQDFLLSILKGKLRLFLMQKKIDSQCPKVNDYQSFQRSQDGPISLNNDNIANLARPEETILQKKGTFPMIQFIENEANKDNRVIFKQFAKRVSNLLMEALYQVSQDKIQTSKSIIIDVVKKMDDELRAISAAISPSELEEAAQPNALLIFKLKRQSQHLRLINKQSEKKIQQLQQNKLIQQPRLQANTLWVKADLEQLLKKYRQSCINFKKLNQSYEILSKKKEAFLQQTFSKTNQYEITLQNLSSAKSRISYLEFEKKFQQLSKASNKMIVDLKIASTEAQSQLIKQLKQSQVNKQALQLSSEDFQLIQRLMKQFSLQFECKVGLKKQLRQKIANQSQETNQRSQVCIPVQRQKDVEAVESSQFSCQSYIKNYSYLE